MADDIDDIVVSHIPKYNDLELKAINKSGALDDLKSEEDKEREKEVTPLLARIKEILVDRVKDVVASNRLTDMPSCIVADQHEMSVHMQQMLQAMGQQDLPDWKPILEINPNHDLVRHLQAKDDRQLLEDVSFILLDQALMMDGVEVKAPNDFVKRLNRVMLSGL
jgi:molecular chaperone HtpG